MLLEFVVHHRSVIDGLVLDSGRLALIRLVAVGQGQHAQVLIHEILGRMDATLDGTTQTPNVSEEGTRKMARQKCEFQTKCLKSLNSMHTPARIAFVVRTVRRGSSGIRVPGRTARGCAADERRARAA